MKDNTPKKRRTISNKREGTTPARNSKFVLKTHTSE
jgi:hypothetical protein